MAANTSNISLTTYRYCGNESHCINAVYNLANSRYSETVVFVAMFMTALMVVGTLGNALVVVVYAVKRTKTSANYAFMILGGLDLFACIFIHPYVIYKIVHRFNQTWVIVCKTFEFLIHSNLSISSGFLMVVAFDRYFSICQPLQFYMSYQRIRIMTAVSFTVGIGFSVPILEFYGKRKIPIPGYENSDVVGYGCDYSDTYTNSLGQSIFGGVTIITFFIIVILIVVLYSKVGLTIYKRKRQVHTGGDTTGAPKVSDDHKMIDNGSSMYLVPVVKTKCSIAIQPVKVNVIGTRSTYTAASTPSTSLRKPQIADVPSVNNANASNTTINKKILPSTAETSALKAPKLFLFVTAVFLFSWLPFWILKLRDIAHPGLLSKDTRLQIIWNCFLNHLFYINNAANPFIYVIANKSFRNDCRQLFKRYCRPCHRI